ncbi:MAG: opioid growth factor receptor-related protein [Clostridia bacterium]|nr:opioid growth factor receptor-related protein [Clostridia bacterium]
MTIKWPTSSKTKRAQKILTDIFGKENYNKLIEKIDALKTNSSQNMINIPNIKVFVKDHIVNQMGEQPKNSSGFDSKMKIEDIIFDKKGPIANLYHSPGTRSSGNFSKLIYNPLVKNKPKNIEDEKFKENCKKLTKKYLSLTSKGENDETYKKLISDSTENNPPDDIIDEKTRKNWNNLHRKKNKNIIEKATSDRLSNVLKSVLALIIYHWAYERKSGSAPNKNNKWTVRMMTEPLNPQQEHINEWIDIIIGLTVKSSGWRYKSGEEMRGDSYDNLESHHDYIQVFFPNKNQSQFSNQDLYLSNEDFKKVWQMRKKYDPQIIKKIQDEMKLNFKNMLDFWGFVADDNLTFIAINKDDEATKRREEKICSQDHNNLRVTRVLLALRNFGLEKEAKMFYESLKGLNPQSEPFWKQALTAEPAKL